MADNNPPAAVPIPSWYAPLVLHCRLVSEQHAVGTQRVQSSPPSDFSRADLQMLETELLFPGLIAIPDQDEA